MKTGYIAIFLAVAALSACDRGSKTPQTRESGTATPSVPVKPGEKSDSATAGGASAQAERGSGTSATTSSGTTTSGQSTSTGGTTR
jgi:hypothetical protein